MKNILWRNRWLVIALLVPVFMCLAAVSVLAASMVKPIQATVEVNLESSPEGAFGFYQDAQGSIPITTLNFGQLKPGVTGVTSIYIKNLTITTNFDCFSVTDDLTKGTTTIYPYDIPYHLGISYLKPSEIYPFDVYLDLDPLITPGTYNFVITVTGQTQ